ncbi:hypothetical protein B0J11DRAFT_308600 [Dendryphion nanum]|uniref:Uncharacterized protein n=1 Tax=Dendryphion nanum TaxID=256645 RepID=A0A9P9DRV9_9PLEO|nr:hypothetical protein B0J11DRAFT_308600 [Dendryphion nanum]
MKSYAFVLLAAVPAVMAQASCTPHDDHWHCPAGVPQPTFPPGGAPASSAPAASAVVSSILSSLSSRASSAASSASSAASSAVGQSGSVTVAPSASSTHDHSHEATAATCEPHDDHWHCPSGVSRPTTPPAQSTTRSGAQSAATTARSSSVSQFTGAAAPAYQTAGAVMAAIGAFGALLV